VGLERGPLSLVSTTEELLERKVATPVWKAENRAAEIRHADNVAPSTFYPQKVETNFDDKRLSLDRYSSLADSDHRVYFFFGTSYYCAGFRNTRYQQRLNVAIFCDIMLCTFTERYAVV
jgi:hypothetical protein